MARHLTLSHEENVLNRIRNENEDLNKINGWIWVIVRYLYSLVGTLQIAGRVLEGSAPQIR